MIDYTLINNKDQIKIQSVEAERFFVFLSKNQLCSMTNIVSVQWKFNFVETHCMEMRERFISNTL